MDPGRAALFTDLYQLTMAQAYLADRLTGQAVFELFFRRLPPSRGYVLAAGLEDVLDYLEALRFHDEDLEYLATVAPFSGELLDALRRLRFTGEVWAVPEGTLVFENEPIVQVVAPIVEAQVAETFILNQVHFQSVIATKASRVVSAARGRAVVDFGSRRAHGTDAALKAARCAYLAGAAGTSNVMAGQRYGIPAFGTMAHSYIQAHEDEAAAFETFLRLYPGTTLLVDTYDTLQGTRKVIDLARRIDGGRRVGAIRLDSGDPAELSRAARALLDQAGLKDVRIFVSSELDELAIARLVDSGAPVDAFGVGTRMVISDDAPALDMAYKLVEYEGTGRMKLSGGKVLYPGRKQVSRVIEGGLMRRDVIGRFDEALPGSALLVPVMRGGRRLAPGRGALERARTRAREELGRLPPDLRSLEKLRTGYPVEISARLSGDLAALQRKLRP